MTKFLSSKLKSSELIVQLVIFPIFAKNKNIVSDDCLLLYVIRHKKKATYCFSLRLTDEGARAQAGYVGPIWANWFDQMVSGRARI